MRILIGVQIWGNSGNMLLILKRLRTMHFFRLSTTRKRRFVFEKELEKLNRKERAKKLQTKDDYKFTIASDELQIENKVNVNQPGVYEIVYQYDSYVVDEEDEDNEKEEMTAEERKAFIGSVRLIVVVNE